MPQQRVLYEHLYGLEKTGIIEAGLCRLPSEFSIILGFWPSIIATAEFVVPEEKDT
jgi:hypothetical protein